MAVPVTGVAALRAETSFELATWLAAFLRALAGEAMDGQQLLMDLERAWFAARAGVCSRRRDSHAAAAAAAVDVLAATPLISRHFACRWPLRRCQGCNPAAGRPGDRRTLAHRQMSAFSLCFRGQSSWNDLVAGRGRLIL